MTLLLLTTSITLHFCFLLAMINPLFKEFETKAQKRFLSRICIAGIMISLIGIVTVGLMNNIPWATVICFCSMMVVAYIANDIPSRIEVKLKLRHTD